MTSCVNKVVKDRVRERGAFKTWATYVRGRGKFSFTDFKEVRPERFLGPEGNPTHVSTQFLFEDYMHYSQMPLTINQFNRLLRGYLKESDRIGALQKHVTIDGWKTSIKYYDVGCFY